MPPHNHNLTGLCNIPTSAATTYTPDHDRPPSTLLLATTSTRWSSAQVYTRPSATARTTFGSVACIAIAGILKFTIPCEKSCSEHHDMFCD